MKKITSLLIALVLIFTFATPSEVSATEKLVSGNYYGKVTSVINGDSFTLQTIDGNNLTVKIAGIDISENPYAYEITQAYLQGKNVRVEVLPIAIANLQPYYYGVVYYNNVDVAKQYLQSGYCRINSSTISSTYITSYTNLQNRAKYARHGIWK